MTKLIQLAFFLLLFCGLLYSQKAGQYKYISPLPNAAFVSSKTNIILRYGEIINANSLTNQSDIKVIGGKSGLHDFNLKLSDDNKTLLLIFPIPFTEGELVNVRFNSNIITSSGKKLPQLNFSFTISPVAPKSLQPVINDDGVISFNSSSTIRKNSSAAAADSIPSDFPKIKVQNVDNPSDGYTLITTNGNIEGIGYYLIMLKNDGTPYWYRKFDSYYPTDFKMQSNGLLSYAEVKEFYTYAGGGETVHKILDSTYAVVDSFMAGNGYTADSHDFQLLPNGHALLISYDLQPVDMSKIISGGNPAAYVAGSVIQELDADKNVVFQWRTWDYIQIDESYFDLTLAAFDPMHANGLDVDLDGNIIVSFRNISQVIKINRSTGEMMWRMGGVKNQFTFINEHQENAPLYFSRPHDIRVLPNGNITLFDNGLDHKPTCSRAVEYKIDEQNKTATLVWEYIHPNKVYGPMQGSVQRLSNGNTMVCWGNAPKLNIKNPSATEVTSDGKIVFEMLFEDKGMLTYRALKYPWKMNSYEKQVTVYELWAGNNYSFNQETDSTYTYMKLSDFTGSLYNYVKVGYCKLAPVYPQFSGQAPVVLEKRISVLSDLTNIKGEISFDAEKIAGQYDASEIVVYNRRSVGEGIFIPLTTSYNSVSKKITAQISDFGEFIFGIPAEITTAEVPILIQPADSEKVNQSLPVKLSWTPVGYVNSYHLQIADNINFTNPVVDVDTLTNSFFVINSVNPNTTYYWHVKSSNEYASGNWSGIYSFNSTAPFITIISPNGSEKIQRGLQFFIRWKDNIDDEVVIQLYKSEAYISTIDTAVSSGIYNWSVDVNLTTGTDYKLLVRSLSDNNLYDMSNADFEIIDTSSTSAVKEINVPSPDYCLDQNYPNPFNPSTQIKYSIAQAGFVKLKIYDVMGRLVDELVDGYREANSYTIIYNASKLTSGIYFYRLESNSFTKTKRMLLVK